jgi:hypothetical protein
MTPIKNRPATPLSWITKGAFVFAIAAVIISLILMVQTRHTNTELERFSGMIEQQNELLSSIQLSQEETVQQQRINTRQIASLKNRLNRINSSTSKTASTNQHVTDSQNSTDYELDQDEPNTQTFNNGSRRYVRFQVTQDNVEVWQNEDGSIQAKNDDPTLTNTVIFVEVEDEAGNITEMTIALPAPDT